jgi:hypothetical protein
MDTEYVEQITRTVVEPGSMVEVRVLRPGFAPDEADRAFGALQGDAHGCTMLTGDADGVYLTLHGVNHSVGRSGQPQDSASSENDKLIWRLIVLDQDAGRPSDAQPSGHQGAVQLSFLSCSTEQRIQNNGDRHEETWEWRA